MVVHDSKSDKLEVDVYIPSEPTTTLSYEQWKAIYDLFMSTMKKHAGEIRSRLPTEIENIFRNLTELGPWTSNRRDDCIERFRLATNELNDTIYERFANASDGDVEQFLNEVVRMYQHEKESVKDTKESLRQQHRYYGGIKAVIPTKWSTNSQLHQLRSIWYWALPTEDKNTMQEAGLPKGSIGEYMLLNLEEDGWFSAKMDTGMMRCKFVDDYASRMKTALIGQCEADASNPFVEIPGLIFEEKAEETLMMVLNKVHLLFILVILNLFTFIVSLKQGVEIMDRKSIGSRSNFFIWIFLNGIT